MTMTAKGLAKLIEECGELQQVAGKKLAYFHTDEHPDGAGPLSVRLEHEMGDVMAAIEFVARNLGLDWTAIIERKQKKYQRFFAWDVMRDNNEHGVDRVAESENEV